MFFGLPHLRAVETGGGGGGGGGGVGAGGSPPNNLLIIILFSKSYRPLSFKEYTFKILTID
jgi:hypothetical protein